VRKLKVWMLSEPQQAQESEWTNRYLEGTVEIQLRIGYVHELFCAVRTILYDYSGEQARRDSSKERGSRTE